MPFPCAMKTNEPASVVTVNDNGFLQAKLEESGNSGIQGVIKMSYHVLFAFRKIVIQQKYSKQ